MSVNFKFNKIQLQRTRPDKYRFPIGLSFGQLGPSGNAASETSGGLQKCLAGGAGTPGTVSSGNTFHIFANPSGSGTFTPSFSGAVDIVVVAGGGAGGSSGGGGGGGGGVAFAQNFPVVTDRNYTVTVGAGGSQAPPVAEPTAPTGGVNGGGGFGTNSSFTDTTTSISVSAMFGGGGAGRLTDFTGSKEGRGGDGGSSGGGCAMDVPHPGGPGFIGTATQPNQNPGISGVTNHGHIGGRGGSVAAPDSGRNPGTGGGGGGAGQEGAGMGPGPNGSAGESGSQGGSDTP